MIGHRDEHTNHNSNRISSPRRESTPILRERGDNFAIRRDRHDSDKRMKPQMYSGDEDLEEYLAHFEIVSEINGWNYDTMSLFLASSLTGTARTLLNELDMSKRRDYKSLVDALKTRFGS